MVDQGLHIEKLLSGTAKRYWAKEPQFWDSGNDTHLVRVVQEELQPRVILPVEIVMDVFCEISCHLGFCDA